MNRAQCYELNSRLIDVPKERCAGCDDENFCKSWQANYAAAVAQGKT